MKFVLASLLILAAPAAFAGETICSSADQRVSTAARSPDGGAPFEPTYKIVLDGHTVFERDVFSGSDVRKVGFAASEPTQISYTPASPSTPQINVDAYRLKLTELATGAVVFDDFVLCKAVSRPCPLCPGGRAEGSAGRAIQPRHDDGADEKKAGRGGGAAPNHGPRDIKHVIVHDSPLQCLFRARRW
jgi:hypothetical protein